jgi:Putative beta barrel porin-7 (BBP7)
MRKGFLVSLLALLQAGGLALAQSPPGLGAVSRDLPTYLVDQPPPGGATQAPASPGAGTGAGEPGCPPLGCFEPQPSCCGGICGPPGRFWVSAEYLLWWIKDDRLPPLVTAGPASSGGVLGAPGTTVLYGGGGSDEEPFSGGRFTAGYWLNDCQTVGIEASFFFLGERSNHFVAGAPGELGEPVVARPIINALTGTETSELVPGTITVRERSRLLGTEINGICNVCCACCARLDLFAGFEYLELDEDLTIEENLAVPADIPTIGGTRFLVSDSFGTRNFFYGGQLGARGEVRRGRFFVDGMVGIGLGDTHQDLDILGSTIITPPGGTPVAERGGILALPSNIGQFSRDRFSVVPQVGINLGYQVTPHLRAFIGYTFLYWTDVIRPGEQIDRVINPTQIPSTLGPGTLVGPARPEVLFKETDFWAQGINFGIEFRF